MFERKYFGRFDLCGNPAYDDVHGRIFIPSTKHVVHHINHLDNGVDLVFNGLTGINALIFQLTRLRDDMVEKATGSTIVRTINSKGE